MFQFIDRNSVDLDEAAHTRRARGRGVSIPRSEFCGFRLDADLQAKLKTTTFQFLDRNSVDLDFLASLISFSNLWVVSIPRSEFCGFRRGSQILELTASAGFQFLDRNSVDLDCRVGTSRRRDEPVSIPRSEFCGFRLTCNNRPHPDAECFNSSIGILWI